MNQQFRQCYSLSVGIQQSKVRRGLSGLQAFPDNAGGGYLGIPIMQDAEDRRGLVLVRLSGSP